MKKLTLCIVAAALTAAISTAKAEEAPPYKGWVGGFAQYYGADITKGDPIAGLKSGTGIGAEAGFRFGPSWALRFELGRLDIDNSSRDPLARDDDGTQLGADVMYFTEFDDAYFFGGLREQALSTENFFMGAAGVGKHWEISDTLRVITEVAAYHDFGNGHREFSAKLGLAYVFGANGASGQSSNNDIDGDGVDNAIDRCPSSMAGEQVDDTGCKIDMDGDGVLNAQDQCPMTAAGTEVDATGCAIKIVDADSDGDGVLDSVDNCLDTGVDDKVDANGCTIFEERQVSVGLEMLFGNNSSVVTNPDSARIEEFAAFMARFPTTQAVIEGHTSSVGDANYNQMLSEKRANAVRTLLIEEYGVDGTRVKAIGYGETRLKNTANTAEAHRANRRIDVTVTAKVESKVTR